LTISFQTGTITKLIFADCTFALAHPFAITTVLKPWTR
jgi:hypothetical protein